MTGYVLVAIAMLYLGICFGLLNQVSAIKDLKPAKPIIPVIPFLYVVILLKMIFYCLTRRTEKEIGRLYAWIHVKIALMVMLYSFSQTSKEFVVSQNKHVNQIQHKKKAVRCPVSYSEYIKLGSKMTWDNIACNAT